MPDARPLHAGSHAERADAALAMREVEIPQSLPAQSLRGCLGSTKALVVEQTLSSLVVVLSCILPCLVVGFAASSRAADGLDPVRLDALAGQRGRARVWRAST